MKIPPSVALPSGWEAVLGLIAEHAAQSDLAGVPRSHFDAMAAVGAHGTQENIADPRVWREFTEQLAGADASTWFCWAQHQTPMRALQAGGNSPSADALQKRWLDGMRSGQVLAAVAFGHLRRPGSANPVAKNVDGGWVLDGSLDWVTSWDIADLVLVMAHTEDKSQIVTFVIPIKDFESLIPGSRVGEKLELLSMSGTHTRPVYLDNSPIPSEFVLGVTDHASWQRPDVRKTNSPNIAALGIARAAIEELGSIGESRDNAQTVDLANALQSKYLQLREHAGSLMDQGATAETQDLITVRVEILELARDSAAAVVIARAGAGMQSGRSAERRVRESLFLQIQAQTEITRNATLQLMSDRYLFNA